VGQTAGHEGGKRMSMDAKETRRDAGTPQRAEMGAELDRGTTSNTQNTTAAGRQSGFIADLLSRGAENGVTLRHLKDMTGQDGRTVRRQIEAERRRGVPICADCKNGYYLPDGEDERARCVRSMRGRAKEILLTAAAIEKGENYTE